LPNLINQTPWYRPQPQDPEAFAQVRDVDPTIAKYAGIWAEQARSFKAWEPGRFHMFENRARTGDAVGPSVIDTPLLPYSRWVQLNDVLVAQRVAEQYQQRASFKPLERRRIDEQNYFGDLNPGPSVLNGPDDGWVSWFTGSLGAGFDQSIVTPIYELPNEYRAPDRRQIDVRAINQPDTDWQYPQNDAYTASQGAWNIEEVSLRSADRRAINVAAISEPEFAAWFQGTIAQTITPVFQRSERTQERLKINTALVSQPDVDWEGFLNSAGPAFDTSLWPAIDIRSSKFTTVAQRIEDRPRRWNYPVVDMQVLLPAIDILQSVSALRPSLSAIVEPEFTWIYPVTDALVAKVVMPEILLPLRYRSADSQAIDTRRIVEPNSQWLYNLLFPPVAFDPKLWPAVVMPSYRAGDRRVLNVRGGLYLPDFGWLTVNIPAIVIATGMKHKRKWRRS